MRLLVLSATHAWGRLLGTPPKGCDAQEALRAGKHAAERLPGLVAALADGHDVAALILDGEDAWRRKLGEADRDERWPADAWAPLRETAHAIGEMTCVRIVEAPLYGPDAPTVEYGDTDRTIVRLAGLRSSARDVMATIAEWFVAHASPEDVLTLSAVPSLVRADRVVLVRDFRYRQERWEWSRETEADVRERLGYDPRLVSDVEALASLPGLGEDGARFLVAGGRFGRVAEAQHGYGSAIVAVNHARGGKLPGMNARQMSALVAAGKNGGAGILRALAAKGLRTDAPGVAEMVAAWCRGKDVEDGNDAHGTDEGRGDASGGRMAPPGAPRRDQGGHDGAALPGGRAGAVQHHVLGERGANADAGTVAERCPCCGDPRGSRDDCDGCAPGNNVGRAKTLAEPVTRAGKGPDATAATSNGCPPPYSTSPSPAPVRHAGAGAADGIGRTAGSGRTSDGEDPDHVRSEPMAERTERQPEDVATAGRVGATGCKRADGVGDAHRPVGRLSAREGSRDVARRDPVRRQQDARAHQGEGSGGRSATQDVDRRGTMKTNGYNFTATDATRESILLRAAICGPTGSGKTKTGIILGTHIAQRLGLGPLYVVDSESKSALRYAYSPRTKQGYRFKHVPMPEDDYSPAAYMAAIDYCEAQGAGVILIDSLSHAWNGINGVLEQVDKTTDAATRERQARGGGKGSTFSDGWRAMTPVQNALVQRILSSSAHIFVTMRAEMDYVVEGQKVTRVGMMPVQRKGLEYEFDLFFDMTQANWLIASKSRSDLVPQGFQVQFPGEPLADSLCEWIDAGDSADAARADSRTLGEAVNNAVAEGIIAAEERSTERYKEAKRKLIAWCDANGVSGTRRDLALGQFKERVALVAGPKPVANGASPGVAPS